MPKLLCHRAAAVLLALISIPVFAGDDVAGSAIRQGRLDEAAASLRVQLSQNPQNALAHQLLCRVFYAEELADQAVSECEAAVSNSLTDPVQVSENQMWLGRAYGMKASHANPIAAFRIARKVVAAFERAVAANDRNVAAFSDLGEVLRWRSRHRGWRAR